MNNCKAEAIGFLLFASQGTRPDINYAVNFLSKFNNNPNSIHWSAVKRTKNMELCYSKEGHSDIHVYSDADWANDSEDRRSVTGYLLMLHGGPISWASKRQLQKLSIWLCQPQHRK